MLGSISAETESPPSSSSDALINGVIVALHKLITEGKTKKQMLKGIIQSRFTNTHSLDAHAHPELSWEGEGDKDHSLQDDLTAGSGRSSSSSIHRSRDSTSSMQVLVPLCSFEVVCRAVGVDQTLPTGTTGAASSSHVKFELAVTKACREVAESKEPFRQKSSLVRLVHNLTQASLPSLIEDLVSAVVKRAICHRKEAQCVQFLQAVKNSISDWTLLIALKFSPHLFTTKNQFQSLDSNRSNQYSDDNIADAER